MPQRSIQTHAYLPKQRILWNKSFNSFGHNLQLPSNHDRFEDGNHQKQVTMLYRIICLKKATNFVVTNNCLSCFQKAVLVCFPPRRQQIIKTCREQQFCVHFKLPPQLPENKDLLQSSYVSFILPLDRTESTMNGCSRIVCVFITPRPQVTQN